MFQPAALPHLSCREAHPGVCLKRDASLFRQIITLGMDLESFFSKDWIGRCCRVFPQVGGRSGVGEFVMLCHRRTRRPRIHVTHAFVALHCHDKKLKLVGDLDDGLTFMSQYGLAKHMLVQLPTLSEVFVEEVIFAKVVGEMKVESTRPPLIAWPKPKAASKPRTTSVDDELDALQTEVEVIASKKKASEHPSRKPRQPQPLTHNKQLLKLAGSISLDASMKRVFEELEHDADDVADESDDACEEDVGGDEGGPLVVCVPALPVCACVSFTVCLAVCLVDLGALQQKI